MHPKKINCYSGNVHVDSIILWLKVEEANEMDENIKPNTQIHKFGVRTIKSGMHQ